MRISCLSSQSLNATNISGFTVFYLDILCRFTILTLYSTIHFYLLFRDYVDLIVISSDTSDDSDIESYSLIATPVIQCDAV